MAPLELKARSIDSPADLVRRRLSSLGPLSDEAATLVSGLDDVQEWPAGAELIAEQGRLTRPMFLVSGWAARVRLLADGRRQIVSFVLPGDAVSLCRRSRPRALCAVVALTEVQTLAAGASNKAPLPEGELSTGLAEIAGIAAALEEAHLIDQVVRLGRQTAYERLCHLFLELLERLKAVGLAEANRFRMPLTQEVLADATGLSTVHVNRVLQQQRRERLFELNRGWLTLLEPELTVSLADYRKPEPAVR